MLTPSPPKVTTIQEPWALHFFRVWPPGPGLADLPALLLGQPGQVRLDTPGMRLK
jgi:hypothetical protein